MTEYVPDQATEPPEFLEFLVGSWNRVRVLDALATAPRTRDDLVELTGASRPTISRILSDLTDRGWIVRRNSEYEATPLGEVVAREVEGVVGNVETAETLDGALEWLPTEQLGFDLAHLAAAKLLTPTFEDQTGPMRQLADTISRTERIRIVATGVTYEIVDELCRAGVAGELAIRCVLDDRALAGLRSHPDLAAMFVEMVERGTCEAYRYGGSEDLIDCNLLEEVVMFCGHGEEGRPAGILLSEDATVRSWMAYYFERLCDGSERLPADAFAT